MRPDACHAVDALRYLMAGRQMGKTSIMRAMRCGNNSLSLNDLLSVVKRKSEQREPAKLAGESVLSYVNTQMAKLYRPSPIQKDSHMVSSSDGCTTWRFTGTRHDLDRYLYEHPTLRRLQQEASDLRRDLIPGWEVAMRRYKETEYELAKEYVRKFDEPVNPWGDFSWHAGRSEPHRVFYSRVQKPEEWPEVTVMENCFIDESGSIRKRNNKKPMEYRTGFKVADTCFASILKDEYSSKKKEQKEDVVAETQAMLKVYRALKGLTDNEKRRVIDWAEEKLGLS